jgi:hypothetical protein
MSKDDEPEAEPENAEANAEEPFLEDETRSSRVLRFARRLMDRKELAEDTRDLVYAVLNTSDKAKTEAVRLVAREVRNYLRELKLKETLVELATEHSLEISIHLKPLPKPEDEKKKD